MTIFNKEFIKTGLESTLLYLTHCLISNKTITKQDNTLKKINIFKFKHLYVHNIRKPIYTIIKD